jgi:putative tryptophan/tyrosine transport system substrate-binding protein
MRGEIDMKNTMKRLLVVFTAVSVLVALAACSSGSAGSADGKTDGPKKYKIGVIQYATHPSLDNCYTGIQQGLEEAGMKDLAIDFQNAQGDNANGDLIAKNMVSKKYDLIMGIATPAAMSAYSAARSANIPVVFTAVSDPVAAGIVKSNEKPGINCTGTSDVLPLEQQIKMIRAFLPGAKKIGILYTTSEPNSVSQLATFKALAPKYNFEVVDIGVTNASEVAAAAASIVSKGVDCINNFTDNNVVDNLSTVLQAADGAKIPVFGSEEEQVKNGCLASQSIDYVALGKVTGKMAADILTGKAKASDTPVYMVKDCTPVYNKAVMEKLQLKLPEEYAKAAAVTK